MKKNYSRSIQLRCVVCGSERDFEYNEDKSFIKCTKCNREYPRGYDELVSLNHKHINDELETSKQEILIDAQKEIKDSLKKVFNGNKYIKIK